MAYPYRHFSRLQREACIAYQDEKEFPEGLWDQALEALAAVEEKTEKKFGDQKIHCWCHAAPCEDVHAWHDGHSVEYRFERQYCQGMVELTENKRFNGDSIAD